MEYRLEFVVTIIANVISITAAFAGMYNKIDKRLTIIETEMKHKINYDKLLEKLDEVKIDIKKAVRDEVANCRDYNC